MANKVLRTAEEIKIAVQKGGITKWKLRDCSICGYPLNYIFEGDRVLFDAGCDCTKHKNLVESSYKQIAELLNLQDDVEVILDMEEELGLR